jgi:putative ABC transport system substrate-binding protein
MSICLRRREFIAGLGGAAAWPLAARAQQGERVRRIGFLTAAGFETDPVRQTNVAEMRDGLAKLGWIEGRNLRIDLRFGAGDRNRIRFYAQELVRLAPDVMIVTGASAARVMQELTRTIPIIFVGVGDPVANGLVGNIAQPEGNVTGFANMFGTMIGKSVELLKEAAPHTARIALLFNPETLSSDSYFGPAEAAATVLGVQAIRTAFRDVLELVRAVDEFAAKPGGSLLVPPTEDARRSTIFRLAAQHRLPAVYPYKYYALEGGLMAYGPDNNDLYRHAPSYVDRLLRGAKVSDLPVQFPTKFELVINLKTAKAIGLTMPPTLLAIATEVIE